MFTSLTLCKISLSCSYDRCTTSPQVAVMERAAEHALRCSDPDVEHALRCLELEVHMRTIEQHCCVPSIEVGSVRRCIDWDVWHRNIQPIVRSVHQCTHWGVHHHCIYTPPLYIHHPSKLEVYTATLIEDPTTHRRWSMVIDGEISNTDTCSCNSTSSNN